MSVPHTATALVEFVSTRIAEYGITIKPGSRLAVGANAIASSTVETEYGREDPRLRSAFEALRDYSAFDYILRSPARLALRRGFRQRLETALKDGADPLQHGKQTPGRDTQVELFVAAMLSASGLDVELGTPDIRTRLDGQYVYVEAKRPKSFDGATNALRGAVEQVERTGVPGAVFMDLSLPFSMANEFHTPIIEADPFEQLHIRKMREALRPQFRALEATLADAPIAVVLIQCDWLRRAGKAEWLLESRIAPLARPSASLRLLRLRERLYRSIRHSGAGAGRMISMHD